MHVAIVGAGAIGRVLGVRLATAANVAVDFVVRPGTLATPAGVKIERVHGAGDLLTPASFVTSIPSHADAILVCVRANQLDASLLGALKAAPAAPVVVVTPMLPKTHDRVRAALGARLTSTLVNVIGYTNDAGATRYWVSRVAKMILDEPKAPDPVLSALVAALGKAGIGAAFEVGAHEVAAATTMAVLPLMFGLDVAGSLDGLLRDRAIFDKTLAAIDEARALADRCGRIAGWAVPFFRFLGPLTARAGVALARRRSREAVGFVVDHFGRPARAQNVALAAEILEVAAEKGTRHDALAALAQLM
jgi:2-dehydropantoate 2-reductase